MSKIRLGLDLDNTLCDFDAAATQYEPAEMYRPGFFRDLQPLNGSQGFVRKLWKSGKFDIYIVTKPVADSPLSYTEKVEWVARHFPYLLNKIILCQDKSMIKIDILVDDNPIWADFGGEFIEFKYKNGCAEYQRVLQYLLEPKPIFAARYTLEVCELHKTDATRPTTLQEDKERIYCPDCKLVNY